MSAREPGSSKRKRERSRDRPENNQRRSRNVSDRPESTGFTPRRCRLCTRPETVYRTRTGLSKHATACHWAWYRTRGDCYVPIPDEELHSARERVRRGQVYERPRQSPARVARVRLPSPDRLRLLRTRLRRDRPVVVIGFDISHRLEVDAIIRQHGPELAGTWSVGCLRPPHRARCRNCSGHTGACRSGYAAVFSIIDAVSVCSAHSGGS